MINYLRLLAIKLIDDGNYIFKYPVQKQKKFLCSLPDPQNDIERSYFQYRCQMLFLSSVLFFLLNIFSLPLLLYYLFKCNNNENCNDNWEAVFFTDGKPENIIPYILRNEFKKIKVIENKKQRFDNMDRVYFLKIVKKYPFSWLFLLKCLIKIRNYSYAIKCYSPKAIIVCNEYSYTSSLLSDYCKTNGIYHINVMHGEKFYYIRDSFFRYDRCYVWNQGYMDLFVELRAAAGQFIIAIPPSLKFSNNLHIDKSVDYTYYFGGEKKEEIEMIINVMKKLLKKGFRVSVRPHPRYSDLKYIDSICGGIEIEKNITIEESIMRTKNAVSQYSTVLNQAYCNGVNIVINDVSDRYKYIKLQEFKYVMLKVEHRLLSEVLI